MDAVLRSRLLRVLDKTVPGGEYAGTKCWLWTGCLANGYGLINRLRTRKVETYTHRIVYEAAHGPIPEGLEIDHLCRVTNCCNPRHLEAVSHRENMLRGHTVAAAHAAKTHCPQGHAYDEPNTRLYRGQRHCRACRKERRRVRHLEGSVK